MKIKRSCPSNKSWVEKKGVKNGGFCRVLPGKKRSFVAPIGKTAPKMRQVALNSPQEPATDYRGELLSVGITSAVLGALGGSVAAAMLLTPKGSDEAFRSGQQEAALKFEREKAELESKYAEEVEKLKKTATVPPAVPSPGVVSAPVVAPAPASPTSSVVDPSVSPPRTIPSPLSLGVIKKLSPDQQAVELGYSYVYNMGMIDRVEELIADRLSEDDIGHRLQLEVETIKATRNKLNIPAENEPGFDTWVDEFRARQQISQQKTQEEIDRLKQEQLAGFKSGLEHEHNVRFANAGKSGKLVDDILGENLRMRQQATYYRDLSQEFVERGRKIQDLTEERNKVNANLEETTQRLTQLQSEAKSDPASEEEKASLSAQIGELSDYATTIENELQRNARQLESVQSELERHRAIVATYEGTIADLQSQQQQATTEFASSIQGHQRTIAAQANAIKTHEETIAQLKQHIEDLDSQLGNASSENISIATQRVKAASDLDQANIDIIEATAALDKANEELDSMKKKAQDLTRQLGAIHQQHKSEIEKVKSATSAEVSTELNKRISELERAMTIARTEVEEELYPVDSSSKVVTQHYAKATRENLGGIQLGLTIRRNNVALDDIPKEKFVNGVSVATQGLVAPLKEQVLISGSTEGDSLLAEWEKKTVELVDSLKSGAIGTDEFWQQQALAHHQHIRRRDFFLKEVKKIESDHVTEARKIASDFHEAYLAASPEKRDKIIESYGRKFRQQYKEMKSSIFGLQIAIRSNPDLQLDGVYDEEGTIMAIETRDEMKKALGHNEYLLSLLGKKKRSKRT